MKDNYKDFATSYDMFGDITEVSQAERHFYEKIFTAFNVHSVLDCACGTGRHCYMFHNMGYKIKGSDLSDAMLKKARENFAKTNMNIELIQSDFRLLKQHFDEEFDAVVCLTTSLPHLHEDQEIIKALKSMRSILKEKGIVILDQGTTHNSLKLNRRFDVVINNKDFSRIFVKDIAGNLQTINILDLYHSDIENKHEQFKVTYRILLDEDYRNLLSAAGFNKINILGGYDMSAYDPNSSWRLIAVAQK